MRRAFFDSNILLYAFGRDDPRKAGAQALIGAGGSISVQCLNEFASVGSRKLGVSWDRLSEVIGIIVGLVDSVVPLDLTVHNMGLTVAARYKIAIYDAMIVAAALEADCDTLYSEDMHDGLVIDGRLTIVNPFA